MNCHSCKLEASLECGICQAKLCKPCAEFGHSEAFSYMINLPVNLNQNQYCSPCYVSVIQPALREYKRILALAKNVNILEKQPREAHRVQRKAPKPLAPVTCADREETILRLAFQAAELGFNSVINTKVHYKKIRNHGYQKMQWQGSGHAADLDL